MTVEESDIRFQKPSEEPDPSNLPRHRIMFSDVGILHLRSKFSIVAKPTIDTSQINLNEASMKHWEGLCCWGKTVDTELIKQSRELEQLNLGIGQRVSNGNNKFQQFSFVVKEKNFNGGFFLSDCDRRVCLRSYGIRYTLHSIDVNQHLRMDI